jgi:hypothetical protein
MVSVTRLNDTGGNFTLPSQFSSEDFLLFTTFNNKIMAEPDDHEREPEEEEEESDQETRQQKLRLAYILEAFTPQRLERLLTLAEGSSSSDTFELRSLKEVAPGFRGDFINFTLKDTVYTEMEREAPIFPLEFPTAEITPLRKIVPKDATEMKAMDEKLTLISKGLQLALRFQLQALKSIDPTVDEQISDGLFCGLCMTAHAFSALQLERHTTAAVRGRISEAVSGSQVPEIVKKIKKSFFRSKGGSSEAPPSDGEEEEEEPMAKKKREPRRRWFLGKRPQPGPYYPQRGRVRFYRGPPGRSFRGRGRGRGRGNQTTGPP